MKIVVVAGARPNFMKVAPLLRELKLRPDVETVFVHTGQHYGTAMSDRFLRDLDIPQPAVHLGAGSGSHAEQTARVLVAFERTALEYRPDWVVVVGDVNSTLACALSAKKLGIRVAHVEAGLRSFDRAMPEEINRLCTDAIADLLLTSDAGSVANLLREGVEQSRIVFVGNTMIDSLVRHLEQAKSTPLPAGLRAKEYGVVTIHRPGNVDREDTLRPLLDELRLVAQSTQVVFPIHPRTRKKIGEFGLESHLEGLVVLEPLGYLDFLGLMARARFVLTDSGGVQEETTYLGIPCLTIRSNTERPVTCELGTNVLVGNDWPRARRLLKDAAAGKWKTSQVPEMWDGHAAERIVSTLCDRNR